jgi:hypothetical protein
VPPTPTLIARREALRRVALLLGGSVSASATLAALAGCGGEAAPRPAPGAAPPPALDADRLERVAVVAEHILPATDTPGARDVGVPAFIATMLAEHYSAADRARFVAGLDALDRRARRECGAAFVGCAPAAQLALLARLDRHAFARRAAAAEAPGPRRPDPDRRTLPGAGASPLPPELDATAPRAAGRDAPGAAGAAGAAGAPHSGAPFGDDELAFFRTAKELTLLGYYTSEPGATRELRYAAVPGGYEGCVPLAAVGRTWAV